MALVALAAWAAWNWAHTIERIISYYNPLPVWDYWRIPENFQAYRHFDWSALWRQHNEHRIVLPEIVFAADALYLHCLALLPLILSVALYFGIWVVIAASIRRDKSLSRLSQNAAILLCGAVLGWEGSAVVLAVPFLLQWTLAQFCAIATFAAIAALRTTSRRTYLALAITAAVAATYSCAIGLVLWPLLIATAVLLHIRRRDVTMLAVAGTIAVGLFFVGYRFTGTLNVPQLLRQPLYTAGFVFSYLGMPFGANRTRSFPICAGIINVILFLAIWTIAKRKRLAGTIPAVVLLGTFAFTVATALITAAGRMNVADRNFFEAVQARYTTVPLVNWAALFAAVVWISSRSAWKIVSPMRAAVVSAVILLALFSSLGGWLHSMDNVFAEQQVATLSVENGLLDAGVLHTIFPNRAFLRRYLPELRQNHLSIYCSRWPFEIGKPIGGLVKVTRTSVPGAIMRTIAIQGGLELLGWSGDHGFEGRVVIVNENGRIAGFGYRPLAGLPDRLKSPQIPSADAWIAFVNAQFAAGTFQVYALNRSNQVAGPIAGARGFVPVAVQSQFARRILRLCGLFHRNGGRVVAMERVIQ